MTSGPWYRLAPAELESAVQEALIVQPLLRLDDEGDRVVLRGRFEIREAAELVEAFAVEIEPAEDSARGIPKVWEVGGRIPHARDPHHVNTQDGTLCVGLREFYWFNYPDGLSLAEYLEGPLRLHLAGQSMVLRGQEWPAGEWGHGDQGTLEFYRELFQVRDDEQLQGFLGLLVRDRVKGHGACPCMSGKRLRHCHGDLVHQIRDRIPPGLIAPLKTYVGSVSAGKKVS